VRKSTEEIANEMDRAASFEEVKEIIRQNSIGRETFGDRLLELCAEYDKTPGELLKDLTISKSQFYAVLNGKRRPSRVAVIKMVLTLGVNLAEADELLKLAGYKELYPKNREDAVIRFGIEHKKNIYEINEVLKEYDSKMNLLDKE
jgi:transcriptional regulator with XRE-family HTH domain